MALLPRLPAQSSEQAVTLEEGQEIVGTSMSPQPGPRPEENCNKLAAAEEGKRNQRGSWRTMKKLMWHCCSSVGLGGNLRVCCAGVRARISKTHWQKTRPSSHSDLSHAVASIVYVNLCCRIISPLSCMFGFPYLGGHVLAVSLNLISALFTPLCWRGFSEVCGWPCSWRKQVKKGKVCFF